jgi:hypothetical protein
VEVRKRLSKRARKKERANQFSDLKLAGVMLPHQRPERAISLYLNENGRVGIRV